ncbi:MAG: DUF2974 domain-containing protein [Hungatella sp.]|nr:DUF2974 domain-containing protein [Hungatella sp.]
MSSINEYESSNLASFIYGGEMEIVYKENTPKTMKKLVKLMEDHIQTSPSDKIGGQMTRAEYQEKLDQIKSSETLMRMKIEDFINNEETDFRAMTLVDPENEVKPTIVFRGTAGNYGWGDNFAAMFSSMTPSQREATKYVANSGHDHVTLVGHSKGGNLAAACAYALPPGMVDKVYSCDGQGLSKTFLSQISGWKQNLALNLVHNINEYRDMVSQIFTKTGSDRNTVYFDSGVDYYNADLLGAGFDFKMYFFHTHKPNYFNQTGITRMNRTFVPSRIANQITIWNGLDALPQSLKLEIAKKAAGIMYTDKSNTKWSEEKWKAVLMAESVYAKVNRSREDEMCKHLSELYHLDFSKFKLNQDPTSFVVEGAILACNACNNIGELKNIEDHGNIIQGKATASKKDNKAGTNIIIENAQCMCRAVEEIEAVLEENKRHPETDKKKQREQKEKLESSGTVPCKPEICLEWVMTDPNITVTVEGKPVPAVLKKSALPCLNGGMITVEHNGQIDLSDIEKMSMKEIVSKKWDKKPKSLQKAAAYYISEIIEVGDKLILTPEEAGNNIKNQIDIGVDIGETLLNICKGLKNGIESGVVKAGEALDDVLRQMEQAKDNYILDSLQKQVQFK